MKIKDILDMKANKEVISVSVDSTVAYAIKVMARKNVGDVLVMDNDSLVGIFTERDVLACYAKGVSIENEPIKNVMTKNPITFDAATDISFVLSSMCQKNIRHLPVVSEGKVVGVISFRDVVRFFIPEICYMAEQMY